MDDFDWDLGAPLLGDRALATTGDQLAGRRIGLMICGGIAACRTPMLARALRREGAEVIPFVTPSALRFVTTTALAWCCGRDVIDMLDDRAQHIDASGMDLWLVAPATYSTIGKLAHGIADNAVTTTLASALGELHRGHTRMLIAPTMHGSMANVVLRANLSFLRDLGVGIIAPKGEDGKAKLPDDEALLQAVFSALL